MIEMVPPSPSVPAARQFIVIVGYVDIQSRNINFATATSASCVCFQLEIIVVDVEIIARRNRYFAAVPDPGALALIVTLPSLVKSDALIMIRAAIAFGRAARRHQGC